MLRQISFGCVLGAALAAAGCATNYYKVTEPNTGHTYYTEHLSRNSGGGVTLIDRSTGDKVTLQNSDVKRITKEEYNPAAK